MGKPVVILADTDGNYLSPLEVTFLEELNEKIELEVITDPNYFTEHFSSPQSAEILVVSEELYSSDLQKQNIANIYVLSENIDEGGTEDLGITKIFKYTTTKEIYNQVVATSSGVIHSGESKSKETKIILFYSAAGGVGKTTLSMAMCACLAKNYKKALYINAQRINSFQFYLNNSAPISNSIYPELTNADINIFSRIKPVIRTENFDYLPPFAAAISSLNLDFGIYEQIAKSAKATKQYDAIIVDADITFDSAKASLITMADKVVIVTTQTKAAVNATNMLLKNMSCSDREKYLFVCNDFEKNKFNAISETKPSFTVDEYIGHVPDGDRMNLSELSSIAEMQKMSFLVI